MTLTDQARRYLAAMPRAVAGSGGHTATFNAAVVLVRGFAFPEPLALDLFREWNATHCDPPWNEPDLRHKVREAAKSPRPIGYLLRDGAGGTAPTPSTDQKAQGKAEARKGWPAFRRLSEESLAAIGALRRGTLAAAHVCHAAGFLRGAMVDGHRAFILHEGTFAQSRRFDGQPFRLADGRDVKAKNLFGSEGHFMGRAWLGKAGVTGPAGPVLIVEGVIGLLEAVAAALAADADTRGWSVVCATSAGSSFDAAWLERLRGRRVRILPDIDPKGLEACGKWAVALRSVACEVDAFRLPPGMKDLGPLVADTAAHRSTLAELFTL